MAEKLTETVAFRTDAGLKRLIQNEARNVGLRPGDYLRRRVEALFGYAPDLRDSREIFRTPNIEWSEPDDNQDD